MGVNDPREAKMMRDTVDVRREVSDAVAHRGDGRIPHIIRCQPGIASALSAHYGVEDAEMILGNELCRINNRLPVNMLERTGRLINGEFKDEWGICWHGVGVTRGHVKSPPLPVPTLNGYDPPQHTPDDVLKYIIDEAAKRSDVFRVAKVGALWEQATFLRGMANLLTDLMINPGFVHDLLEEICAFLLRSIDLYSQELEIEAIWLSDDYGSQQSLLISPTQWREFVRPRLRRVVEAVHAQGWKFVLHSDGAVSEIVPDIAAMGVDVLNPVQPECVDLRRLKEQWGTDLAFWGGYGTQGSLVFGSAGQVRREVDEVCATLGEGGGFILSPGLGLHDEVPLDNAVAFVEQARIWAGQ